MILPQNINWHLNRTELQFLWSFFSLSLILHNRIGVPFSKNPCFFYSRDLQTRHRWHFRFVALSWLSLRAIRGGSVSALTFLCSLRKFRDSWQKTLSVDFHFYQQYGLHCRERNNCFIPFYFLKFRFEKTFGKRMFV